MRYVIATLIIGIVFLFPIKTLAQEATPQGEFNFQKAYSDLTFIYDKYRQAHSEYELARSQYMQSRTIASQQKAQEATFNMLSNRDDAVGAYLTMLRMRLSESFGIASDRITLLQTKIDTEVQWYKDHKTTLSSAESLEDQTADSNLAKGRYDNTTLALSYEILTEIAIGKQKFLRDQQKSIVSELDNKIVEIRAENILTTSDMERGIIEVRNRIARSESKEAEAQKIFSDARGNQIANSFNQIVFRLNESVQYIKESNTYIHEILRKIKYGQ